MINRDEVRDDSWLSLDGESKERLGSRRDVRRPIDLLFGLDGVNKMGMR